jgi:hypothetical protein
MSMSPASPYRLWTTRGPLLSIVVAVGAVLFGCTIQKSTGESKGGPVLTLDPATVGEIKGVATLDGQPPAPRKILLSGEPECAQLNPGSLFSADVTASPSGELADTAVYIKSGLGNYHFDPPALPARLAQKNCMYEPRVIALMTNQKLEIQNEDPIQHNVHPTPHTNPAFNLTQPIHGPPIEKSFPDPELAIKFMCNLHPWMRAYVFVFAHPYFDVTSSNGAFDLKNVPAGTYVIEAWQEKYGTQDQTVTVRAGETDTINFTFRN